MHFLVKRSQQHAYCPWQYSVFFVDGDKSTQLTSAIDMYSSNLKHRLKRARQKANITSDINIVYDWENSQ